MDAVKDGRQLMQNEGAPPEPVLRFDILYGLWAPGPNGKPVRVENGPDHPNYRYQYQRTGDSTV